MKPKYTPGPWAVNDMVANYVVYKPNGKGIARTDYHNEQALADATLMAAAPEMLEALKLWQRLIVTSPDADRSQLAYLNSVIAKAEGRGE